MTSVQKEADDLTESVMAGQINQSIWRDLITLTKPRIIMSNLVTAWAGFFLAVKHDAAGWTWIEWLLMTLGSALVMASGCVFNNILDREMDQRMARTQHRALPMQRMSVTFVLTYGILLGLAGVSSLYLVNSLSAILGLTGWLSYVWLYTYWLKRTSTLSTVWGGIAGSIPPVIGYCAVTNSFDMGALLLFSFLYLWQPPHFLALAIRRREEYRAAGFPLLPVVHGVEATKIQMVRYLAALIPVTLLFYGCNFAGPVFLVTSIVLGLYWMYGLVRGFGPIEEEKWAKRWFFYSIWYLTALSVLLMLGW